jgi:hypothetical protein
LKQLVFLYLILCILVKTSIAQERGAKGRSNAVSAGVDIPIGSFSHTHSVGIGLEYSLSNHRYGYMDTLPEKPFALTVNAGADHYFGKKEMVGIYPYEYPDYSYLHICGGIIYHANRKTNLQFMAGPALGFYSGNAAIGFEINLGSSYYLKKRIAITPEIILMKISHADPLWVGSLRGSWSF